MSGGYKVVPKSLLDMANAVDDIAGEYEHVASSIGGKTLDDYAVGLLGKLSGLPSEYNDSVATFGGHMTESARRTHDGAQALRNAARVYQAKDEEWWEQFGYM